MDGTRRDFLADVGKGALLASLGPRVCADLRLGSLALDRDDELTFGALEPLVGFFQETPADKLIPQLVAKLRAGTSLRELVAATALANARTFGGHDYVGFHSLMALMPALQMSEQLPDRQKPLPVLKVLYRNVEQIQKHGGRKGEALRRLDAPPAGDSRPTAGDLRAAVRAKDQAEAERALARVARGKPEEALDPLLTALEDKSEVHRVVLTYRSWDLVKLVGAENAHTLLRQAVRYYVDQEKHVPQPTQPRPWPGDVKDLLPALLDRHKLHDFTPGTKPGDSAWFKAMARALLELPAAEAAGAVAEAVADGYSLDAIHEAVAVGANALVRLDSGKQAHGATNGVHASDTVHALGALARVGGARHAIACTILSAWHVCSERGDPPRDRFQGEAHPTVEALAKVAEKKEGLLAELDAAIRSNDQARACAAAACCAGRGHADGPLFELLLGFAVSEDGKLHAEKYYRTVREEHARAQPRHQVWHVVGLARFLASAHGQQAAGLAEARVLLD